MATEKLLTVKDVAARLALSGQQVLVLIDARKIAAVNVGAGKVRACWRLSEEAVEAFLLRNTVSADPPRPARRRKAVRPSRVIEFIK